MEFVNLYVFESIRSNVSCFQVFRYHCAECQIANARRTLFKFVPLAALAWPGWAWAGLGWFDQRGHGLLESQ